MSLIAFFALASATGTLSLLLARDRRWSAAVGMAGLALGLVAATQIGSGDVIRFAGTDVSGSDFARLYLALGSLTGLLTALIASATAWSVALPGAWLLVLAGSSLALTIGDVGAAAAAGTIGALAGIAVTVGPRATPEGLRIARRELRAVVAAGVLALGAAAVATGQSALSLDPAIIGLVYVGFAIAVAIRLGSIPFHLWVARSADTAPPVALPLVMAWAPAAFVVVALAWANESIVALGEPLSVERALIILVAALTIVLAGIAAAVHQDLEHVVGYSIVADGAFALLGLAILDPRSWELTRTFILGFAMAKTAFAALVAAIHSTYGARRLVELDGWARRSPLLGVALLAVFVAGFGLPGTSAFDSRLGLVALALGQPLATGLLVLSLVSLVYYGRLAMVGLRRPGVAVRSGADPVPRWTPAGRPASTQQLVRETTMLVRTNRAPIAAALVLVLAGLAVVVSSGGLGIQAAAAAAKPGPVLLGESAEPDQLTSPGP